MATAKPLEPNENNSIGGHSGAANQAPPGPRPMRMPSPAAARTRQFYTHFGKRYLDLAISSIALLILSPIMLLICVVIYLDSRGSPLFRQTRIGKNECIFTIYKFRTMKLDPLHQVMWMVDENGEIRHKLRSDPRITRVGRWLRRLSMDELPQLVNIIKGDMSLIGPRPELLQIIEHYESWQHRRHEVRPGLTGWWQVSGRSDRPMHENTELDLYYVDNVSLRLDVLILIRTFGVVVKGIGAF